MNKNCCTVYNLFGSSPPMVDLNHPSSRSFKNSTDVAGEKKTLPIRPGVILFASTPWRGLQSPIPWYKSPDRKIMTSPGLYLITSVKSTVNVSQRHAYFNLSLRSVKYASPPSYLPRLNIAVGPASSPSL
jgi:hypothetical protein